MTVQKNTVWKNVTSANPDKKRITDAIRGAAGLLGGKGRVTLVKISKEGDIVQGHVLVAGPKRHGRRTTTSLGTVTCIHPDTTS